MANYIGSLIKEYVPNSKFDEEKNRMLGRIQADIDKTLSIKLTDLDHKRMMSFSMGEEQYKKILQLMLDIEKKIENRTLKSGLISIGSWSESTKRLMSRFWTRKSCDQTWKCRLLILKSISRPSSFAGWKSWRTPWIRPSRE